MQARILLTCRSPVTGGERIFSMLGTLVVG
jgi:hypothetical protein